jgi:hypothetical protein
MPGHNFMDNKKKDTLSYISPYPFLKIVQCLIKPLAAVHLVFSQAFV